MPTLDSASDDCEWVVEKAKQQLERNDKHGARAWIITAKSLFPYRFIVQYEALKLHLACEEYQGAAQSLIELCTHFAREEKLQSLVSKLTEALSSNVGNDKPDIDKENLKKVFGLLPSPSQKKVLLMISDAIEDPLEKGKLVVATLKMFPETALTAGLDMYDILTQTFSRSNIPAAENRHRDLLVTELIPLLATSPCVIVEQPILRTSGQSMVLKTSHICQWLEVAASFYTTLTVQELLLRKKHPCVGKVGWESLHQIFLSVCEKCSWLEILHNKQIGPRLPSKVRWIGLQKISGYSPSRVSFEVPRGVAIACFYIGVFLFFESAWSYYSHVYQIEDGKESKCWALIEEQATVKQPDTDEKPPAKKRKVEGSEEGDARMTNLSLNTGTRMGDSSAIESFIVAMDCWSFLQTSNTYRAEFSRLCQQWGAVEWSWINAFRIDMALYKGDHELYRKLLQTERQKVKVEQDLGKLENLRLLLQLINAYLLLGDSKAACNLATELITLIPEECDAEQTKPVKPVSSLPTAGRSLKLIGCSATDIIPYTLDIILSAVKEMVFSDSCTDTAVGQLMVLSQYNWPKELETFKLVVSLIQTRGTFAYNKFFDYIITIEMLEELMYIINQTATKVNILPPDNSSRTRTVTRGANSKVKEELMSLMNKQLARCEESVDPVIRKFFKEEKLCFVGGSE